MMNPSKSDAGVSLSLVPLTARDLETGCKRVSGAEEVSVCLLLIKMTMKCMKCHVSGVSASFNNNLVLKASASDVYSML